jgi:hypothetical protein
MGSEEQTQMAGSGWGLFDSESVFDRDDVDLQHWETNKQK